MTPEEKARLEALEIMMQSLTVSKSIPRDVETAFIERLNIGGSTTFLAGSGTMVAGVLDITDARIKSTSVAVATRTGSADSSAFPQIATGYLSGTTMRIFEGSSSKTWTVAYIIVF